MTVSVSSPQTNGKKLVVVWLAIAIVLLALSNGRWIVPAATWLGPIFMLHFLDQTRRWVGLSIGLVASFVVWSFSWQEMIPAPGLLYFMVTAIYAVVYFLPYVAHRLVAAKSGFFLSTLVFPTAWVAVDLVFQRFVSPYGSWTSLAYTQRDFLALVQIVSITGTFGVSFVITWFASTVAWLWRTGFGLSRVRVAALGFGSPLILVLAFGAWRMAAVQLDGPTLSVAAVIPSEVHERQFNAAFQVALTASTLRQEQAAELLGAAARLNADLMERTRRAAADGADLIAWSETAARVTTSGASDLIVEGRAVVDSLGPILVMGYGSWDSESSPPLSNVIVIQHPGDQTDTFYRKARPIVGAEAPLLGAGDSTVAVIDIPDLLIAAVICHDLDFSDLIRYAGRHDADLMIGPSADWPEIADMHAAMASLRAVENGFTLIRPTSGGRTIAVDPVGRETSWTESDGVLMTEMKVARVATLYARIGDLFAWTCLAGFLLAAALTRARTRPPH